jgi:hypothetical protein
MEISAKGADPNYQPISITGIPNCNYLNSGLNLVFSDEFNGNSLDTTKWNSNYPWGIANSDSSDIWCDKSEISFNGTSIRLGCNKKKNSNVLLNGQIVTRDYGIGLISSKQKFSYGYYEIRCKIPQIAELWAAFWLFGDCDQELDIFEFIGRNYKASKAQPFHDPLWSCDPFKPRWYIPQECASANPIMSFHTPKNTKSPCQNYLGEERVVERTLEYSSWNVKTTTFNFNRGCVYDDIKVDVNFHDDWHTFGLSFQPDAITWYIDGEAQFTEYKYFIKSSKMLPFNSSEDIFTPICLTKYCEGSIDGPIYEQLNFPRGDINMAVIINNGHKTLVDYNLIRWVDNIKNWQEGYLEVDYFRYYSFTDLNKDPAYCLNSRIDFIDFNVYPNPSSGIINISTNSNLSIKHLKILNSMGSLIFEDDFRNKEHSLDLSLSAGIYFLQLSCNGKSQIKKLLIL